MMPASDAGLWAAAADAVPARLPQLARRELDALSKPLARAKALAGAGAVVDVVARVQ